MIAALHVLDCVAFGVPFRLSSDSGELLAEMERCAPVSADVGVRPQRDTMNFAVRFRQGNSVYDLLIDGRIVVERTGIKAALDELSAALMIHVANYAADRVFVHAGVIGWQGQALILPGVSFAGKTTLVAELVRAGATYYSDEYAVLDASGLVHPYARDLQMRQPGSAEQSSVAVSHLHGSAGTVALPVSNVVFTSYTEGGSWKPEHLSNGIAALEMMRHAIPVQRSPARVMATLAKVMETAIAVRSDRGEATETARMLLEAMTNAEVSA